MVGRVLVVDDDDHTRRSLVRILERSGHVVTAAIDVAVARRELETSDYELVLTDMNMPGESGLDLARSLLAERDDIAVVMVTGANDQELAAEAFQLGTYGYVMKPFKPTELAITVANALRRRELELQSRQQSARLAEMVEERTRELSQALDELEGARLDLQHVHEEMINRLSQAAEFRDYETGQHIERVSTYAEALARDLGLDAARCELIRLAAPLHDVGKIAVPDEILLKPGSLSQSERATMEEHALLGHRILDGSGAELLHLAVTIALTHHERYDGTGYPQGLRGDDIPIEGRIVAVADVFDALTSDRVYRGAMTYDEALELMAQGRGTHFDPDVLDTFVALLSALPADVCEPPLHDVAASI
ncbi:MAG: HD domain-containing phosphohydrolase [Gaiellaceae bacterium]